MIEVEAIYPLQMKVTLTYRFAFHDGSTPHYELSAIDGLEVEPHQSPDHQRRKPLPPGAWMTMFKPKG